MTSFLIAIVIALLGITPDTASTMNDDQMVDALYTEGYTTEQINQELQAAGYDGSGFDLE
ncbi:MAG: hypothetical protein ACFB10_14360 [Salibacteraceae bacterium]